MIEQIGYIRRKANQFIGLTLVFYFFQLGIIGSFIGHSTNQISENIHNQYIYIIMDMADVLENIIDSNDGNMTVLGEEEEIDLYYIDYSSCLDESIQLSNEDPKHNFLESIPQKVILEVMTPPPLKA